MKSDMERLEILKEQSSITSKMGIFRNKKIENEIQEKMSDLQDINFITETLENLSSLTTNQRIVIANRMCSYSKHIFKDMCKRNGFTVTGDNGRDNTEYIEEQIKRSIGYNNTMDRNYNYLVDLEADFEHFKTISLGMDASELAQTLINEDEEKLNKIKNALEVHKKEIKEYTLEKEEYFDGKRKISNKTTAKTLFALTITTYLLFSMSIDSLEKRPGDNGYDYLVENGYEDLIVYYQNGDLTNVKCADLYVYYSKKYNLDIRTTIKIVDTVVYKYVEENAYDVTEEELMDSIDQQILKLDIKGTR